jgi:hypothetical protein
MVMEDRAIKPPATAYVTGHVTGHINATGIGQLCQEIDEGFANIAE